MAQYRFIQNYTTNVSVGGVVGIIPRTFNVGQIVNGIDEGGDNIRVSLGSSSIAIQGASNTILVPKSVLELFVPTQTNDLIDPPNVMAQNPNQLGMGIPSMVTGNATFSISSIDRTKFPLLSDQEISDAINSANNQVQNVGFQRAIEQFQSGSEYRLSQNNPRDTQLGLLINDLLQSKGINTMNRGNQQNAMPMGMGMEMNNMPMGMGMGMGENRRGKKVFSQNIRENVKNALSSLRERVGKQKKKSSAILNEQKKKSKKVLIEEMSVNPI